MHQRVRLEDVAREAQVSKSIASRVLNDHRELSVRDSTRQRVLAAAERLAYRPHAGARSLRRTGGAIALVIPSLATVAYTRIVRGAVARGLELDLATLVVEDMDDGAWDVVGRLLRAGRVDAAAIASAAPGSRVVEAMAEAGIPHVFVNRGVPGSRRNVVPDDDSAAALAAEHLVALGHVRLAHTAGPWQFEPAARRAKAFARHVIRLGLEEPVVESAAFTEDGGSEAMGRLLERAPDVTGVFTSSIGHSIGALGRLGREGRAVPETLSVVGYDDVPLLAHLRPPVTAVRMPFEELGAAATDELARQLGGARPRDRTITTAPELVVRESSASAPSG